MKKSTKAALLSFIVPGAGLWYCGRTVSGFLNLLCAILVPVIGFQIGFLGEHIPWILLAIAAGSAGLAHSAASSASPA